MEKKLTVENLDFSYGGPEVVLSQISLEIKGKFYGLLGPNGTGKSTFCKILAGHLQPKEGRILLDGNNIFHLDGQQFQSIGFVSSESLFYTRKICEIEKLYSFQFKGWDKEYFNYLLSKLNLKKTDQPCKLSSGKKAQVNFALELARKPQFLIVDEGTAFLDPFARSFLVFELQKAVDRGAAVIVATNIVTEVEHLLEHVFFLINGKIGYQGSVEEIVQKFKKVRVTPDKMNSLPSEWVLLNSNSDKTISFLSSVDAQLPEFASVDRRQVTVSELFNYLCIKEGYGNA